MSVNKEARKPQMKLEALIEARALCAYSLHILASNKNFKVRPTGTPEDDTNPPQPELVARMRDTVMALYLSAYSANEVYFNEDNYRHRRALQDKSIAMCSEFLALVDLAIPVFHIPAGRVEYWTGKTLLVRGKLQAWKEADYRAYKRKRDARRTGGPVRRT